MTTTTTTTTADAALARVAAEVEHVRASAQAAAASACCTTDAARASYRTLAAGYASIRKAVTSGTGYASIQGAGMIPEALDLVAPLAVEAEVVLDAELARWSVQA